MTWPTGSSAISGFDPHETVSDATNSSAQLASGPTMVVSMENTCGGFCGLLYWNPATNDFKTYCVTGGFQFAVDLNRSATSAPAPGAFGSGDAWATVHFNSSFSPYMNFRGSGAFRRWDVGAFNATGIRVNSINGKVYFGNSSPGEIIELDPVTNAFRKWTVGNSPYFLVIDETAGFVYATAFAGGGHPDEIVRLAPDAAVGNVTRWAIPGGGLQGFVGAGNPNFISRDVEGQVWFSETASNEVGRLNVALNAITEFTKPGISGPQAIASSGLGPTLQAFFTESPGNQVTVLTHAVATAAGTGITTIVTPSVETIAPTPGVAVPVDFTPATLSTTITPTPTTVTSTDPSGFDRFPVPPGTFNPTGMTDVVFPQTVFGSMEGSDHVFQFTSSIIIAPPIGTEAEKVTGGGFYLITASMAARFGFNVQRMTAGGPITGDLEYHNFATGENIHLTDFTTLTCADTDADGVKDKCNFSGMGLNRTSGLAATCDVEVHDNNEPGNKPPRDSFSITGANCAPSSGDLQGGNIQIHKS
jgi:hypothetical protein